MKRAMDFSDLFEAWDNALTVGRFKRYLRKNGWVESDYDGDKHPSNKCVFFKANLVVKFDSPYTDWSYAQWAECHSEKSNTAFEARQYTRARGYRKRYIIPTIAYQDGLLIQPRLKDHCGDYNCPHANARRIASRLRFSHWWHHGTLNGRMYFFDTDSIGSGWENWKRARKG